MIAALSITHKTAGLNIRESFSISQEQVKPLANRILYETEVSELVIISTCNRTEIYYYHSKKCSGKSMKQVLEILHAFKGLKTDYSKHFNTYSNKSAVKHLYEVTSGVDSMVLGEDQIVKQVKEAYVHCTDLGITDAILMRLFQKSFETGKKVRTQTNIQKGATSVSYVAVELCARLLSPIEDKKILLLGVGDTGKDVLSHFHKRGNKNIILANRTLKKAEALADRFGGIAVPFDSYPELIEKSDIVVTATNAGKELITKRDVSNYNNLRKSKQLFIDLSVPRNIDKAINELDNTEVYGIDDLQNTLSGKQEIRKQSIAEANDIIELLVDEYYEWLENRALRPIIKTISSSLQEINEAQLQDWNRCLSREEIQLVEEYGNKLSQKYIRSFIKNLKEQTKENQASSNLQLIQALFDIE